ncbi:MULTISPECIES: hypothetical protein [Pyrococcus]|uniref:XACb0070 ribbon-helix-helix domain-containing protein n=1 Tax=Pyrococcus furiosus COM1 TaxID=1185654 RepID=I6U8N1_9EURY|nr:hypothetical protein [Pyrococcus furiosus]AFN04457.1 hypothetical protein PFC_07605 [Pyrococcus furiosus COM1]
MGVITVKIPDELEVKFRKKILEIYGVKKGVLGMAITEAIELWLEKYENSEKQK